MISDLSREILRGFFNNLVKGKREDSQAGNIKLQRDTRVTDFSSDKDRGFTGPDQRDTSQFKFGTDLEPLKDDKKWKVNRN